MVTPLLSLALLFYFFLKAGQYPRAPTNARIGRWNSTRAFWVCPSQPCHSKKGRKKHMYVSPWQPCRTKWSLLSKSNVKSRYHSEPFAKRRSLDNIWVIFSFDCCTWFAKQTLEAKADARAYIGPLAVHIVACRWVWVSVWVSEWWVRCVCEWLSVCVWCN